jgi:hypothetical protein
VTADFFLSFDKLEGFNSSALHCRTIISGQVMKLVSSLKKFKIFVV